MEEIQKHFDQSGGDFLLSPGEYQGPLTVSRPCILDGAGSTLWAEHGPVLTITAPGVTIKNLRVEITGGGGYKWHSGSMYRAVRDLYAGRGER